MQGHISINIKQVVKVTVVKITKLYILRIRTKLYAKIIKYLQQNDLSCFVPNDLGYSKFFFQDPIALHDNI